VRGRERADRRQRVLHDGRLRRRFHLFDHNSRWLLHCKQLDRHDDVRHDHSDVPRGDDVRAGAVESDAQRLHAHVHRDVRMPRRAAV
jgi:hypothetical protein